MPFHIIRNDITKVRADAIVNTANPEPVYAAGTDAAVYRAAGAGPLLAERRKIGRIRPGEVAVTSAFRLRAKYLIHTVGPVWQDGSHGEYDQLASCYRKSLLIARQLGCSSIAFPLISTGVYGFPKDRALDIALREISDFLEDAEMDVILVVFDRKAFDLSSALTAEISQYIDENYVRSQSAAEYTWTDSDEEMLYGLSSGQSGVGRNAPSRREEFRRRESFLQKAGRRSESGMPRPMAPHYLMDESAPYSPGLENSIDSSPVSHASALTDTILPSPEPSSPAMASKDITSPDKAARPRRSLQDLMSQTGENFQECLLRMIDERGLTDAQVYKRANIDRKLFSKIRCKADYTPSRKTAISLAVALELNLDEMTDLLRKAGIALSPGSKFDLIIRYCVENRIYDTIRINAILFDYDQPLLGA